MLSWFTYHVYALHLFTLNRPPCLYYMCSMAICNVDFHWSISMSGWEKQIYDGTGVNGRKNYCFCCFSRKRPKENCLSQNSRNLSFTFFPPFSKDSREKYIFFHHFPKTAKKNQLLFSNGAGVNDRKINKICLPAVFLENDRFFLKISSFSQHSRKQLSTVFKVFQKHQKKFESFPQFYRERIFLKSFPFNIQ